MPSEREVARRLLARWHDDPVLFAQEALGAKVWSRQAEILRAVAANPRTSVRSGHKVSKSHTASILAWWWFCTRDDGRVILTSSSFRQIERILWREIVKRNQKAVAPIVAAEDIPRDPETGIRLDDGREIVGVNTNTPERMAGFSGANLLFVVDEASGIDEQIFEAIEGNRAGGARIVMFGNPTQTSGTFYDSHHGKRQFWCPIHVSSEETPNVVEGRVVIPGLATAEWVAEKRQEWGEDSALYAVRVRGDFPEQGERAVVPLTAVTGAVERWTEDEPDDGALSLGLDVARFGDDESVLVPRRGLWAGQARVFHGLDGPNLAGEVLACVREWRRDGERPRVKVDVIGVGASVFDVLARSDEVEAIAVNVSEAATADGYASLRDQLWGSARDWLKDGGAMPDDARLQAELVAAQYEFDARGRMKVESKDRMKKRLGRSPDRADALALAIYEPPPPREFVWVM